MHIYNTLSGRKEELPAPAKKELRLFVCGPTVYDSSHIGHARTYLFFDVFARYLKSRGTRLFYLQNITDVDDKIIKRAQEAGADPLAFSARLTKSYLADMRTLAVRSVTAYAPATRFIKQIVRQVQTLIDKGYAYLIEGDPSTSQAGGYYFDIAKFTDYGKLSRRTAAQADDAVSRIDENVKKRSKGDFCLWKFSKPGEPSWKAPFGAGRPGWHIEDTAITDKYFGPQYDIHGGGEDLKFPHHEAEIAQQESASGKKPFVRYWMHAGFLVNKEQKMSKSLGNFQTANELLKKYPREVLRFFLLSGYYRSPLEFSDSSIKQSQGAMQRISEFAGKLDLADGNESADQYIGSADKGLTEAMDDDFNTPQALAALFQMIKNVNPLLTENRLSKESAQNINKFLKNVNSILGIIPSEIKKIPDDISDLARQREDLREAGNYEEADKIRAQIGKMGYRVDDTVYGPLVLPISR